MLGWVYGMAPGDLPRVDLIVSAGGRTMAANIAAARLLGVPNIFYGSLRHYRSLDFGLTLSSYARPAGTPRHVVTLKPSKLDPDTIVPLEHIAASGPGHPPPTAGLLVGGDTRLMTYRAADWTGLLDFVRAQHRAHGTRWIAANSPRTPDGIGDALAALEREPQGPLSRFIDIRRSGPGTLAPVFANCAALVVTADSSSMLSEAIWVRRPALSVAPRDARFREDEADYRCFLESRGWMASLLIAELTPERFLAGLARITPMRENPMDQLAQILVRELPELFPSMP